MGWGPSACVLQFLPIVISQKSFNYYLVQFWRELKPPEEKVQHSIKKNGLLA